VRPRRETDVRIGFRTGRPGVQKMLRTPLALVPHGSLSLGTALLIRPAVVSCCSLSTFIYTLSCSSSLLVQRESCKAVINRPPSQAVMMPRPPEQLSSLCLLPPSSRPSTRLSDRFGIHTSNLLSAPPNHLPCPSALPHSYRPQKPVPVLRDPRTFVVLDRFTTYARSCTAVRAALA
jgi:hypothetical protein